MNSQPKYIIVGAGLAGLTCAYELLKRGEKDFLILESRDRVGGRILTRNGIDFGATWFQGHHQHVHRLCRELGIAQFPQYSQGQSILVYSSMAPAHHFENDPSATPASRITDGTSALIKALADQLTDHITLNTKVASVHEVQGKLKVATNQGNYSSDKMVITVPPLIATIIHYEPALPAAVVTAMENTHTWMSNAIKLGMTFRKPFWRDSGLSGMIIGQNGPVTELYDHSNAEDSKYALMGFVNEALRDFSEEDRKRRILDYLSKHLGQEVLEYLSYEVKDWSEDWHTSCESIKSFYMSPQYGDPVFHETYLDNTLIFSGAETSPTYGGYMDGAIHSGMIAASKLTD